MMNNFFIRLPRTACSFVPRKFIDGRTRILIENLKITKHNNMTRVTINNNFKNTHKICRYNNISRCV